MDIKKILGEEFKDGMTAEEQLALLMGKNLADLSTGEYVSSSKLIEAEKKRKELEALKLTEEEKIQLAIKEKDEKLSTLMKELNREKTAKVFASGGLVDSEYNNLLDLATPETATFFVDVIKKKQEEAKTLAQQEMLNNFQEPPAGVGGNNEMSKEKFSAMSLDEKMKLKIEHPEVYEIYSK